VWQNQLEHLPFVGLVPLVVPRLPPVPVSWFFFCSRRVGFFLPLLLLA